LPGGSAPVRSAIVKEARGLPGLRSDTGVMETASIFVQAFAMVLGRPGHISDQKTKTALVLGPAKTAENRRAMHWKGFEPQALNGMA